MYNLKGQHFHFIGCEKINMAGLALLLHARGATVSASAAQPPSYMTEKLSSRQCTVYYSSDVAHIADADTVVFGPHIPKNHPVLQAARSANRTVIPYATLLAESVRRSYTIATAGTYSTTMVTTLIGYLLHRAHLNPTVLTRGIMRDARSSAVNGTGAWAVVDSKYAVETIQPTIALIHNLESLPDEDTSLAISPLAAYEGLLKRLPYYGTAVLCYDDTAAHSLRSKWHGNGITYGLGANADIRGHIVELAGMTSVFNVTGQENHLLGTITLPLPGSDNVRHALGAIAVCHGVLGLPFEQIKKSLAKFSGVARHFEKVGTLNHAPVIDERAWHPNSVNDALMHARSCGRSTVHVVFQLPPSPHTQKYWQQFLQLFIKQSTHISTLHIVPIDGETKDRYDSEQFVSDVSDATKNISLFCYQDLDEANDGVRSVVQPEDVVLVIGPGTVETLAQRLVQ